jgi:gluconate 2-dehydrogenase gamma chain
MKSDNRDTERSVFDAHERAAVEAATARIIPTDHDPGAREAGVIEYIERIVMSYESQSQSLYHDGVKELDKLALDESGAGEFRSLKPEQQDKILAALENRKSPFFSLLVRHTMEGFYGDSRHGGNKNRVGWKILGFPGPGFPDGHRSPLGWYDANVPDDFGPKEK